MALTDVSEALFDPDFCDPLQCIRNSEEVTSEGLSNLTPDAPQTFYGCVTNKDGDRLKRGADGEHQEGSITVHTVFRLISGKDGKTADIIVWRGTRYTVTRVKDYSNFGRGFVAAECDLLPLSGGSATP